MYLKKSDTNRGKKSFTVMAIYIVAVHKQALQRSFKNRQCHVNNISIHLEHSHEQDEKKLKDNNYEHEGKGKQRTISPPDRHKSLGMSNTSCRSAYGIDGCAFYRPVLVRSIQFYPDTEMTTYHEHVSCLMSGLPVKVI